MNRWMDGCMDWWTDGCMDVWTDGRMNASMGQRCFCEKDEAIWRRMLSHWPFYFWLSFTRIGDGSSILFLLISSFTRIGAGSGILFFLISSFTGIGSGSGILSFLPSGLIKGVRKTGGRSFFGCLGGWVFDSCLGTGVRNTGLINFFAWIGGCFAIFSASVFALTFAPSRLAILSMSVRLNLRRCCLCTVLFDPPLTPTFALFGGGIAVERTSWPYWSTVYQ